ncbi:MAG: DEAD/DEAH box helicase [Clostridium sp.]|nr:MAG: DEAD/DEAH box helicase [Clostridium sp.]
MRFQKSSFIDLLIPILYGKTVILVGDHRQLPPMYEFSKLRDDDFEGLDENIINKDIGVICTYGDQARKIKEVLKSEKVKNDAFKTDIEKMIVSTVDDFQGDERDIIILSTVRNPENPAKSNPGFILAYQRINVALSRARSR